MVVLLYMSKTVHKWLKSGDILVTKCEQSIQQQKSAPTGSTEGLHTKASTLTICLGNS
jgi:hypothetical protein